MAAKAADKKLVIKQVWCKGCCICAEFCPKSVLRIKDNKVEIAQADQCVACGMCEMRCPDYAIYLEKESEA